MVRMIKYPSIEQFAKIKKHIDIQTAYVGKDDNGEAIYDYNKQKPTIVFNVTEKIHGTNASVAVTGEHFWVQSRERVITPAADNMGCAAAVHGNLEIWDKIVKRIAEIHKVDLQSNTLVVYFEWCGGNIQAHSALTGLDKHAIIFEYAKVVPNNEDKPYWISTCGVCAKDNNIRNIVEFPVYMFAINFENEADVGSVQNTLIKLVEDVIEPASPVGKALGKPSNIGEGLVGSAVFNGELLQFKIKGDKHSKSPVKSNTPVDVALLNNIDKCVEAITHNWRFEQGLQTIFGLDYKELDRKKLGEYIKWVNGDTIKEELDVIIGHGLEPKQVLGRVSDKAKKYFFAVEANL